VTVTSGLNGCSCRQPSAPPREAPSDTGSGFIAAAGFAPIAGHCAPCGRTSSPAARRHRRRHLDAHHRARRLLDRTRDGARTRRSQRGAPRRGRNPPRRSSFYLWRRMHARRDRPPPSGPGDPDAWRSCRRSPAPATCSWSWRRTDLINAASRSAALDPAELTANEQVCDSCEVVLFVASFQGFCRVSAAVQYRFTRERSLVQAQPCPSERALATSVFLRRLQDP
jgi:hypothetical protein